MKLMFLLKRKPGTTFEQFRDYYEKRHAPLAVRLLPYFESYERNYILHDQEYGPSGIGAKVGFDVVTCIRFKTRTDYERMLQALSDSTVLEQIVQDEERFMDRSPEGRLMFVVDEVLTPAEELQAFAAPHSSSAP